MSSPRICLVSPGHVASNPRLVKEADALQAAGFQVRVVAGNYMPAIQPLDRTILSKASWSWMQVELGGKADYLFRRLKQEVARAVISTGWIPNLSFAIWANSPMSMCLAQAAMAEPASLYIAHCLAALPAAALAAQKHKAKLGFDAEDFHVGELFDELGNNLEVKIRDFLERNLLPQCDHLTAASPLIADAYCQRYGIKPLPTLNVFPLSEAPKKYSFSVNTPPRLYWFSQTIGPGRGLEKIIVAMGQMQTEFVQLYLRGLVTPSYRQELETLAMKEELVPSQLNFLPSAPPGDMFKLAAEFDLGLSLELSEPLNRALCLTNKIFTYLLGGIPVLLSLTPAQNRLAPELGEAAILADINDPVMLAKKLDVFSPIPRKYLEQNLKLSTLPKTSLIGT
jgi:hypothetical protein